MALAGIDMFGGGLGGVQAPTSGNILVEMKAGKCVIEGTCVSPDKRKGMLLIRQEDDGLRHLVWMCRETNEKEDDLIVVDDAFLERVPECTTGRVYVLRFTSSDKKMLFWLQGADESKDEALIRRFNVVAGGEPSGHPQRRSAADLAAAAVVAGGQQGAVAGGPATRVNGGDDAARQQQQLTNLLLRFAQQLEQRNKATGGASQTTAGGPPRRSSSAAVPLSRILTAERLRMLCDDPLAMEELKNFVPQIEEGSAEEEVRESAECPQLAHGQHLITQAVYSEQLPLLMGLMGLPQPTAAEVAAVEDPMLLLVEGLEKALKDSPPASSNNSPSGDANADGSGSSSAREPTAGESAADESAARGSAAGDGGEGERESS